MTPGGATQPRPLVGAAQVRRRNPRRAALRTSRAPRPVEGAAPVARFFHPLPPHPRPLLRHTRARRGYLAVNSTGVPHRLPRRSRHTHPRTRPFPLPPYSRPYLRHTRASPRVSRRAQHRRTSTPPPPLPRSLSTAPAPPPPSYPYPLLRHTRAPPRVSRRAQHRRTSTASPAAPALPPRRSRTTTSVIVPSPPSYPRFAAGISPSTAPAYLTASPAAPTLPLHRSRTTTSVIPAPAAGISPPTAPAYLTTSRRPLAAPCLLIPATPKIPSPQT